MDQIFFAKTKKITGYQIKMGKSTALFDSKRGQQGKPWNGITASLFQEAWGTYCPKWFFTE